jgi:uncharacterized phage protein (TIGR01671 family)
MNREIKFRAWDTEEEEMYYSDKEYDDHFFEFVKGKPTLLAVRPPEPNSMFSLDPPEPYCDEYSDVMEFTGHKDKNGKEIWEGDIVKYCHYTDCDTNKLRVWKIAKIVWGNFRFKLEPPTAMEALYISKMYEVIGNIYENPELMENK